MEEGEKVYKVNEILWGSTDQSFTNPDLYTIPQLYF